MLTPDRWCPRNKCMNIGTCQYSWDCKSIPIAEKSSWMERVEKNKLRQRLLARQEENSRLRAHRELSARIDTMLSAHDISLYEFTEWLKVTMK